MTKEELDKAEIGKSRMKEIVKYIIYEIIFLVYFFIVAYIENKVGYITFGELTKTTVFYRFIQDALVLLFPSILVLVCFRKHLGELGFNRKEITLCLILLGIYILFFLLRRDYFSIEGCYKFFFYLFLTAFGEEVWSRGFIYLQIRKYNKIAAIIISGVFFGVIHSVLPAILQNYTIGEFISSMISQIGGGIVSGMIFVYHLELSGSIFVPMLVHSLLDYSYGMCGMFVAVATAVYLAVKRYIKRK